MNSRLVFSAWWRILEKIYSNKSKCQTRTEITVLRVRELFEIPFLPPPFFYPMWFRWQRKFVDVFFISFWQDADIGSILNPAEFLISHCRNRRKLRSPQPGHRSISAVQSANSKHHSTLICRSASLHGAANLSKNLVIAVANSCGICYVNFRWSIRIWRDPYEKVVDYLFVSFCLHKLFR